MGGNVAKRLVDEGFDVVGFDLDEELLTELETHGGRTVDSNAELAAESDVVLSALSYPEVIEAAYLGDDGVVAGAQDDLICVEQSTVPPEPARQLSADLAEQGIDFLDAPFLGGVTSARDGTLVLPVGGERAVYEDERVQAVFEAISRQSYHMGEAGNGKSTKLVNNCISLGNSVLAYEALALGKGLGLEVGQLHEALRAGAGSSVALRVFLPSALNGEFPPIFPVSYTQKDLRYALRAAEGIDYPMHVVSQILNLYTAAAAKGHKDEAASTVLKVFEEWVGEPIVADERVETPENDPIYTT